MIIFLWKAALHLELLFIHPYREGNGRSARLVATLMALQAGDNGFNREIAEERFADCIKAIQTSSLEIMTTMLHQALLH
ncbi:MAG: Fic family protein [Chlorobiaceae bacterium]|nr:Fic family protein [Chlorobiaceae bacterium]